MLNELDVFEELILELNFQKDFFHNNSNSAVNLLTQTHLLDKVHNRPKILQIVRKLYGAHDSEKSEIIDNMELQFNIYFKGNLGEDYKVKFKNMRDLTFSIWLADVEIVRFSVMNKDYARMREFIDEKEFRNVVKNMDNNIVYHKEVIELEKMNLSDMEKLDENYWSIFKDIKSLSDIFTVLFKKGTIKNKLPKSILRIKQIIEHHTKSIEDCEQNKLFYKNRLEQYKPVIEKVSMVFKDLGYKETKIDKFYM